MLTPQFLLPMHSELVVDLFAGAAGEPLTKTAQVRMCGNSVCPPLARTLVAANYLESTAMKAAA
jgi:DNA (cytosine-5)-methyltransferase 1